MTSKMIIIGIVLAVLVIGVLLYKKPVYQIAETRDFSCPGMEGFTFKYPVFEGWEPEAPKSLENSTCSIFLNYPNTMSFEIAPQIKISRIYWHGIPGQISAPEKLNLTSSSGVQYGKTELGYDFWLKDSLLHIELFSIDNAHGFSLDQFWKTVIESFKLKQ